MTSLFDLLDRADPWAVLACFAFLMFIVEAVAHYLDLRRAKRLIDDVAVALIKVERQGVIEAIRFYQLGAQHQRDGLVVIPPNETPVPDVFERAFRR